MAGMMVWRFTGGWLLKGCNICLTPVWRLSKSAIGKLLT
jgi:hypothetical protein